MSRRMGVAAEAETIGEIDAGHPPTEPGPAWETTPSSAPILHLAGFDGPMDLLLDLAERQRLHLGQVSLVDLVDQFVAALAKMSGQVPIDRLADWVVLATRLVLLRSRLLTATPDEVETAERDAAAELLRLDDMSRMRRAVQWLDQRPVLGRDVFGPSARPQPPHRDLHGADGSLSGGPARPGRAAGDGTRLSDRRAGFLDRPRRPDSHAGHAARKPG